MYIIIQCLLVQKLIPCKARVKELCLRTSWVQELVAIQCYCRHSTEQLHGHHHSSWPAVVALTSSMCMYGGSLRNIWLQISRTNTDLSPWPHNSSWLFVCYRKNHCTNTCNSCTLLLWTFCTSLALRLQYASNPGIYLDWDLFHLTECLS